MKTDSMPLTKHWAAHLPLIQELLEAAPRGGMKRLQVRRTLRQHPEWRTVLRIEDTTKAAYYFNTWVRDQIAVGNLHKPKKIKRGYRRQATNTPLALVHRPATNGAAAATEAPDFFTPTTSDASQAHFCPGCGLSLFVVNRALALAAQLKAKG